MEILQTVPPYCSYRQVTACDLRPVRGAVLVVKPDIGPLPAGALEDVAARVPWAAVVVVVAHHAPPHPAEPGLVRISLAPDRIPMEPDQAELRRLLTDPTRLGDRVARWTRRTFPTTSPHAVDLVRCLVSDTCNLPTGSSRSFRRWLRTDGLPPPHWWERTGQCLRGILWLQRHPEEILVSAALRVGFSEASGFSRACITYLGQRPGSLRRLMGWQWILWNALTRAE